MIAIGNVRLFEEVQAKTRDLRKPCSYQTASADMLKVISRSPFDLQTVFSSASSNAPAQLCGADRAAILALERQQVSRSSHPTASRPIPGMMLAQRVGSRPWTRSRDGPLLNGEPSMFPTSCADPEVHGLPKAKSGADRFSHHPWRAAAARRRADRRAVLRREVLSSRSPSKQIDLVTTFADQAVIAIENVRLFDEVQAKTRDLTEA